MRILSAHIGHETNTFAVHPTTLDDFRRSSPDPDFRPGALLLDAVTGTGTVHGGFVDATRDEGFTLDPLIAAWATPGGIVECMAYDALKSMLLERIDDAGMFDGILLDLHGAMIAEGCDDVEGDLLESVRALAGPDRPVVVTLDLHANVSSRMAKFADAVVGFDEYPHIDMRERGREAGLLIARRLRGEIRPVVAHHPLPLITMPPKQCTFIEPMRSLLALARAIEEEDGILNVTIAMGFPFADVPDAGVSVLVTADGDGSLARRAASRMASAVWTRRDDFTPDLVPVDRAIRDACLDGRGPVIMADGSDNPGGGSPCDGTVALEGLIRAQARSAVVAVIADPDTVARAVDAGVGRDVSLLLGGKTDDRHGTPLRVDARVRLVSDGSFLQTGPMGAGVRAEMGRAVVIEIGGRDGIEVIVTERRIQPFDAALPRSVGIEPENRRIVVLKSAVHFRSTYEKIASRIVDLDTPGIHRPDFSSFDYRRLRRPCYPVFPPSETIGSIRCAD